MTKSATTMKRFVDDMSSAAMIQRGELQLQKEPISVRTVMDDAIESVNSDLAAKEIEVVQSTRAVPKIEADRERLKQIFVNLLANAIKFSNPNGTIRIEMGVVNGSVEIKVSDKGCGISPQFLPYVFERFRRAKTVSKIKGQGLGLAIVKGLVELHNGTIKAESDGDGLGATFTVRFPTLHR